MLGNVIGTYHAWGQKYAPRYLAEFSYRFYQLLIWFHSLMSLCRLLRCPIPVNCGWNLCVIRKHLTKIDYWGWTLHYPTHASTPFRSKLQNELHDLGIKPTLSIDYSNTTSHLPLTVQAIRWHDTTGKSSIRRCAPALLRGFPSSFPCLICLRLPPSFAPPSPRHSSPIRTRGPQLIATPSSTCPHSTL